jgi:hypothetical protein
VLMAGRELTTVDEDLVYRKANEAFAAVLGRMDLPPKPSLEN